MTTATQHLTDHLLEQRVIADHAAAVGTLIRAHSVECSNGDSWVGTIDFPEPLTLRITDDAGDLLRWMDNDHLDPWYFVELVDAPPASAAILAEEKAHVVAVYGPCYRRDGYEKPEWKVLAR